MASWAFTVEVDSVKQNVLDTYPQGTTVPLLAGRAWEEGVTRISLLGFCLLFCRGDSRNRNIPPLPPPTATDNMEQAFDFCWEGAGSRPLQMDED